MAGLAAQLPLVNDGDLNGHGGLFYGYHRTMLSLLCALPLLQAGAPGQLIVLEKNAATARLLDTREGKTVITWPVGDGPHEVALSPDGRYAMVANYGGQNPGSSLTRISLLEMNPENQLRHYELEAAIRPHGLTYTGDSRFLWLTAEVSGELWRMDTKTGTVAAKVVVGGGGGHMLARQNDGRLFVSHIGAGVVTPVISTGHGATTMTGPAGWTAREQIPTGAGAEGIAVRPQGKLLWVGNRAEDTLSLIDTKSLKVVATLPCEGFPIRVNFSNDGAIAAVTCATANEVALFDAETHELMARISTGDGSTPIGMAFNDAGTHLYVSCSGSNQVADIDLRLRRVVQHFSTGEVPDGLAWMPTPPPQNETMAPAE